MTDNTRAAQVLPLAGAATAQADHAGTYLVEPADERLFALVRLTLGLSALVIIWIDPAEPARWVELTYTSLVLYCMYSAIILFVSFHYDRISSARVFHWLDVVFYVYLVSLTEGTQSIFFFFFFLAIVFASFTRGFREGLLVTIVSGAAFMIVGLAVNPAAAEIELNRTILRPIYLFAIGYIIARWGEKEIEQKRRFRLLHEIGSIWNARLGADYLVGRMLDALLRFYGGSTCILVLERPGTPARHYLHSASPGRPGETSQPAEITGDTASELLRLPASLSATLCDLPLRYRHLVYDVERHGRDRARVQECRYLANLLDTPSFVTVPYAQRDGSRGRIYLASANRVFGLSDIEFLVQVAESIAPAVENLHLMDELIGYAAKYQRVKISRDMHDTTIQPYIGLKLALDALHRGAEADNPLTGRIRELAEMTDVVIQDLRNYADWLKRSSPMPGESLIYAIREQAGRFRRFYGIDVQVHSEFSAPISGPLAADAYQLVSEGLHNILRHTSARRAFVSVSGTETILTLQIGNEVPVPGRRAPEFTPKSIRDRTQALGGRVEVQQNADGYTVVDVSIPM